jgi:hypothetical protein
LNHFSGARAGIAGVYQRHDWAGEKRAALEAWAAKVQAAIEGGSVPIVQVGESRTCATAKTIAHPARCTPTRRRRI